MIITCEKIQAAVMQAFKESYAVQLEPGKKWYRISNPREANLTAIIWEELHPSNPYQTLDLTQVDPKLLSFKKTVDFKLPPELFEN